MEIDGNDSCDSATSGVYCDPCRGAGDTLQAAGFCKTCQEFMCQTCARLHRRQKITKNHDLLEGIAMPKSRAETTDDESPEEEICRIHAKRRDPVRFYCPKHNEFGCGDCVVLSHRTCKVEYIADAAKCFNETKEFRTFVKSLDGIARKIDKIENTIEVINCNNKRDKERVIHDIQQFQDEINTYLEKKVAQLSSQVDDDNRFSEVTTQNANDKMQISAIKSVIQSKSSNIDQLFMFYKRNQTSVQKVKDNVKATQEKCACLRECMKFERNTRLDEMVRVQEPIGTVTAEKIVDYMMVKLEQQDDICITTKEDSDEYGCRITGIAQLSPDLLVLADNNNEAVKVVNIKLRKVTSQLRLSAQPWDIVVLFNKQIAVTVPLKKEINVLSLIFNSLQKVRTIEVSGICNGIAFRNGQLAILYKEKEQVEVMDTSGVVTHIIKDKRICGYNGYTCFSSSGNEVFVTCKNNAVCKFSLQGDCLATYSHPNLRDIYAMTATRDSQLLVCESDSHNIYVLSQTCRKMRVLLSKHDNLCYPQSLCLFEDTGTLYVGNFERGIIQVFEIPKT